MPRRRTPEQLVADLDAAGSKKALTKARGAIRLEIAKQDESEPWLRAKLAEHYRTRGVPSEAARWGITVPGWATAAEIRDLRRWLLGRYSDHHDYVRDLLGLATDRELPAEVRTLVQPAFIATSAAPLGRANGGGCALIIIALLSTIVSLACWTSIVWSAGADAPDLTERARALAVGGVVTALLSVGSWIWLLRKDRAEQAEWTNDERSDPLFVSHLAWRLFDEGDERAARILLTAGLRCSEGDPVENRRALVEMSRRRGRLDQAGRWGVGIDGETSPQERQRFAAMLAAQNSRAPQLMEMALLSGSGALTSDAEDVYRRAGAQPPRSIPGDPDRTSRVATRSGFSRGWAAVAVVVAVAASIVIVLAVAGSPAAPRAASWALAVTCIVAAPGIGQLTIREWRDEHSPLTLVVGLLMSVGLGTLGAWLALVQVFGWE